MRKLKLQVQISIDGFIAGPQGEMDWMTWNWDNELAQYVTDLTEPVDCILLGRVLAEGFIPVWESRLAEPEAPDAAFAGKMVHTPKVVFSKTLDRIEWNNTTLAKQDLATEIMALKQQPGQDIIAYGGATFVSNLIEQGLIDELHLFVNPAALGNGMRIFKDRTAFHLVQCKGFECGIVVLHYEPIR
ncbi:MAG: dihydrofolate reductase family protein [Saprospiraceae bacterium]|nr:dihydrofolate reductase family protein [Saprospiraceae bacterium]